MNDIELIKKLAGVGKPNPIEELKKWADSQLTNQPKIENQAPCPTLNDFQISEFNEINTSISKVKENFIKNLEKKGEKEEIEKQLWMLKNFLSFKEDEILRK